MSIEELNESFIKSLVDLGFKFPNELRVIFNFRSVEVSAGFGSEVTINLGLVEDDIPKISVGNSGAFSPQSEHAVFRVVFAYKVLENWDVVIKIVNEHVKKFVEVTKELNNGTDES